VCSLRKSMNKLPLVASRPPIQHMHPYTHSRHPPMQTFRIPNEVEWRSSKTCLEPPCSLFPALRHILKPEPMQAFDHDSGYRASSTQTNKNLYRVWCGRPNRGEKAPARHVRESRRKDRKMVYSISYPENSRHVMSQRIPSGCQAVKDSYSRGVVGS
jgi:hypothetical protein